MTLYDGLADIFAASLGEPVVYTPKQTGAAVTINAIWTEETLDVAMAGDGPGSVDRMRQLAVSASDVAAPAEGDTALRMSTNETLTITQPIKPDGHGMIVCMLRR